MTTAIGDGIAAYPLHWPAGKPRIEERERDHFAPYLTEPKARRALMDELRRLGAADAVLSSNLRRTRDGALAANQRTSREDPGAAVYFSLDGQQRVMSCDRWRRLEANVWAIAKMIEAMRGIARWGGTDDMHASFQGFAALPAGGEAAPDAWWDVLGVAPDVSRAQLDAAYKRLAKVAHPDNPVTGDPERFLAIQAAWETGKGVAG